MSISFPLDGKAIADTVIALQIAAGATPRAPEGNDNPSPPGAGLADAARELADAAMLLSSSVAKFADGPDPLDRLATALDGLATASGTFKAEFARMDALFSAVLARLGIHGLSDDQADALTVWAGANAALFRLCADTLGTSNAALARLA